MKKLLALTALALTFNTAGAYAASLKGFVSDSMCAAKGKANATSRELEELGGIDIQIEGRQLRGINILWMHHGVIHVSHIGGDRSASQSIAKRIKRHPSRQRTAGREN